jgi:type II secretory pathway component GspD/PulD (secretin)
MQAGTGELVAVRQEILQLLRQQIDALNSPLGLTDARLTECYERQARVQELREKMQALSNASGEAESARGEAAARPSSGALVIPASLDTAANL